MYHLEKYGEAQIWEDMCTTLLAIKYAFCQCTFFDESMRAHALPSSLLAKDSNSLYKHVSATRNKKNCPITKVDDCVGNEKMTDN